MKKFIPKNRKKEWDGSYPIKMSVEEASYWRKLELICKLGLFPFGSIWAVGEKLWREVLPSDQYDQDSGREMHPGLCTEPPDARTFPAAVRMFFGTHSCNSNVKKHFVVENLFDDGDQKPCHFGSFPPAAIDPTYYGKDESDVSSHIRKYKKKFRMLSQEKQGELRKYLRDYYSMGVK